MKLNALLKCIDKSVRVKIESERGETIDFGTAETLAEKPRRDMDIICIHPSRFIFRGGRQGITIIVDDRRSNYWMLDVDPL